jgi:hypothetical protein
MSAKKSAPEKLIVEFSEQILYDSAKSFNQGLIKGEVKVRGLFHKETEVKMGLKA